jgi:[ribosomal protein S18]-alanine N-acetyltransferase
MMVSIGRLQESDLDEVMRVEHECFHYPWKRQFFAADLNRAESLCLAARAGGRLLGYAIVWRTEDELHLANIAVAPDVRHQGIGAELLRVVIDHGRELPAKRVYLEVRRSNLIAQLFYRSFGFFQTYTRREYYPDKEDALVLEREL